MKKGMVGIAIRTPVKLKIMIMVHIQSKMQGLLNTKQSITNVLISCREPPTDTILIFFKQLFKGI